VAPGQIVVRQRKRTRVLALLLCLALTVLAYQNRGIFYPAPEVTEQALLDRRAGGMEQGREGQPPPGWVVSGDGGTVQLLRGADAASGQGYVLLEMQEDRPRGHGLQLMYPVRLHRSILGQTLVLALKCRVQYGSTLAVSLREQPAGLPTSLATIVADPSKPVRWQTRLFTHEVRSLREVQTLEVILELSGAAGQGVAIDDVELRAY
jgi:hypothetical protein